MTTSEATSGVESANAAAVRNFNDALNNRDRAAILAAFADDGAFRPAATGKSFEGPEAAAQALYDFLDKHESGQFETVRDFAVGDEVFSEWRWAGKTKDGESVQSHGADYFLLRDGLIVLKNTFRKV